MMEMTPYVSLQKQVTLRVEEEMKDIDLSSFSLPAMELSNRNRYVDLHREDRLFSKKWHMVFVGGFSGLMVGICFAMLLAFGKSWGLSRRKQLQ